MALVVEGGLLDVEQASGGELPADPTSAFERWSELRRWAATAEYGTEDPAPLAAAGPPSPSPRQIFAIGLNYVDHAAEAGVSVPTSPLAFTKFVSSLTGPDTTLTLPSGYVDWEAELVVVVGRRAFRVAAAEAWDHVAGLTVGQDLSERRVQLAGDSPQYSLGKSYPGFAPTGPVLVTPDELDDPDDLGIECVLNGETVQSSRTNQLVFGVPELVERLSHVCPLLPGDLIFTGTPAGVGGTRTPPRFLTPGDTLVTTIEGIGSLVQRCVGADEVRDG